MNREQKLALLKRLGVKMADTATDEEIDTALAENADVKEEEEEVVEGGDEKVEAITEKQLAERIAKGVTKGIKDLEKSIEAKFNTMTVKSTDEKEMLKKTAEQAQGFVKALAGMKTEFQLKTITTNTNSFGYTIPEVVADYILEKRDKISKMRKYAFVLRQAGDFSVPVEGTAVTSYWVGDNEEITESSPTVGQKVLKDHYLATRVLIPRSLLNSSAVNILNYLGNLCSRSIRKTEETAFVGGDGSAKPTGFRGTSVSSVAQAGANLAYLDLVTLNFKLPEQYRDSAIYMTSKEGMALLFNLKDTYGMPIFDMRTKMLWTNPLVESADIPANLGSGTNETEIWFGDFSYYWIKDGEELFVLQQPKISALQIELVVAEAVDGIFTLPEALVKLTGVK